MSRNPQSSLSLNLCVCVEGNVAISNLQVQGCVLSSAKLWGLQGKEWAFTAKHLVSELFFRFFINNKISGFKFYFYKCSIFFKAMILEELYPYVINTSFCLSLKQHPNLFLDSSLL